MQTYWAFIQPFRPASKSLEILLPAAVDLLFQSNDTEGCVSNYWTGIWNRTKEWEMVNIRSCSYCHYSLDPIIDGRVRKKIQFLEFPIIRKAAPLIIFEWFQFSGRTRSSSTTKRLSAKRNGRSHGKMSLVSTPGSVLIKTTLMKSPPEALFYTQTVFLSKQIRTIAAGRQRDAQTIGVLGAYTLLRWFSTTNNTPWGKKASVHG